jgi:DNA-binding response OmpR family regulator
MKNDPAGLQPGMNESVTAHGDAASGSDRRIDDRHDYETPDIEVWVQHPGGNVARLSVTGSNLSAGGIAFHHRGFLYDNTPCKVVLPTLVGGKQEIHGRIVRCTHLNGQLHEVGVSFSRRVDPRHFMVQVGLDYASLSGRPMELPDLRGRILHVEMRDLERQLLAHHLKATGLKLRSVESPDEALHALANEPFDLLITALSLGETPGEDFIKAARDDGFRMPIIVLTAETNATRLTRAKLCGATHIVQKPYDPAKLLGEMSTLLRSVNEGACDQPIFSKIPSDGEMSKLLDIYLDHVRRAIDEILRAIDTNDLMRVRGLCLDLKGNGASYGFPVLTEIAAAAVRQLDSSQSIRETINDLHNLINVCRRLRRAPASPAEEAA